MGLPRQSSLIAVVLVALAWHACRLTAARPTPYSLTTREGAASSRNTHSEHVHGARAGQHVRSQEPRPEAFDTIRTRGLLQQQPQSLSPTQPEGGAAALAASAVSGLAGLLSLPVLPPLPETVNIPGQCDIMGRVPHAAQQQHWGEHHRGGAS
ncbi:hypothetical protein HaLaN_19744 [Haematococcus lacustris]|uniref:Uncharacterized protein n=1 Tax=Haematococcus lacustris TaxID=44745 RepID=A0A699ZHV3_HAELA|nr:hypothetical protein HaLaN_19744 [Haematococcus lacustris]